LFQALHHVKIPSVKTVVNFIGEVRAEMAKVVWPKKEEVIKLTLIVFIISGIIGGYVGALDYAFTKLLELFISR
jgi:preprotein translocase subunit SecE